MTLNHVRDYLRSWLDQMTKTPAPAAPTTPALDEESDDDFESRMHEKFSAQPKPGQPGWDRPIDRNVANWWQAEYGQLQIQLNKSTFGLYIKPMRLVEAHDNHLWLEVPDEMVRTRVDKQLMRSIREALAGIGLKDKSRWNEIEITLELAGETQIEMAVT
jgi:hypothetical protein